MKYRMSYDDPTPNGSIAYARKKDIDAKHDRDARRKAKRFIHDLNTKAAAKCKSIFKRELTGLARVRRVRKVIHVDVLTSIPIS
jgi:hypothetical protein